MISVRDFHSFMATDLQLKSSPGIFREAHILRLDSSGRQQGRYPQRPDRVALVMDGEECLDRLYGGYFPDWSSGGQWRNMVAFLTTFFGRLQQCNVHMAVVFNGAVEPARFSEWKARQMKAKANVRDVMRHLARRMTPPPKAFWVPPSALRTIMRLALQSLNVSTLNTVEDHHQEIMAFCWENGYHGILSDDGEFALFNPPRYFSAHDIKLSLQHDITTTEYVIDQVAKALDLNPNRFGLVGALLGCHILPSSELADFHQKIVPELKTSSRERKGNKVGYEKVIKAVANYVRALESVDDYDVIANDVFGGEKDLRIKKVREAVKYFYRGTKEGYANLQPTKKKANKVKDNIKMISEQVADGEQRGTNNKKETNLVERIALDLDELDLNVSVAKAKKEIVEDKEPLSVIQALASGVEVAASESGKYPGSKDTTTVKAIRIPKFHPDVKRMAMDRHRSGQMSPYVYQILTRGEIKLPVVVEAEDGPNVHRVFTPLRQRVYAVLHNLHHARYNRHQMEEEAKQKRRRADELRKRAKTKDETVAESLREEATKLMMEASSSNLPPCVEYTIREWLPYNGYERPESVDAVELSWPVPTVQKLWFSPSDDDKQKRIRAFMSCLHCDDEVIGRANIQPHLLLMTCVLRYIVVNQSRSSAPILEKPDIDAFLATALSPELRDVPYLADMSLEVVTIRGVHLASLFMQGVEMAILANDVCGAPLPHQMCLPWLFFDGKLFHSKLVRASKVRNLVELCDGRMEIIYQVELMRSVILHGVAQSGIAPTAMHPRLYVPPQMPGQKQPKKKNKYKIKKKLFNNGQKKSSDVTENGDANGDGDDGDGEPDVVVEVET